MVNEQLNNAKLLIEEGKYQEAINIYSKIMISKAITQDKTLIALCLSGLIQAYLYSDNISSAEENLIQLEELNKNIQNKKINLLYRFNHALLLKNSNRVRKIGQAQEIFVKISNEEIIFSDITIDSILNHCEMLINEFKETKNEEILNEINPILTRLSKISQEQKSFRVLAESYLLEAKFSLVNFEMKKARYHFTRGQQIAEKYGYHRLAIRISDEHDKLLQNESEWDQFCEDNESICDRIEEAELTSQIQTMIKRKISEEPEISPESPILLLIMGKSGISFYTKIFNDEWKVNEDLFSGFLSAFNSFSDEIFSDGLDRVNFKKFTILMTNIKPFTICYVYKGQSFSAQQSLTQFNKAIQDSKEIWNNLEVADKTGHLIQPNSNSCLEEIIKSTFDCS